MPTPISLKTVLIVLLALVFLLLGQALFLAGLSGTRDFLQRQLASHAQDTASTLALQLSDELARADMAAVTSSVDALFDSGYYRRITLSQPDGKVLLDRQLPVVVEGAPQWFVNTIPLATPSGRAESMSSWKRTVVQVTSHPGFAYQQLWTSTRDTLLLALLFWAIAAMLGAILLTRALRPLADMEILALGVARGEFSHLPELPRVRELRHIGQSMNLMSDSVRRMLTEKSDLV